ncbi:Ribokinase [Smittium culicis]|uniref:Ribokinase n=1 Tax=Smittium culicis TaxID=133412 RepID=A0A1R1YPU2_9FUNG|nr:Ribokinase [Smittium culicis]
MAKLIVFGSLNIDEVYTVPHIVKPGETISSSSRVEVAGGKGANSSVAGARAGGKTYLLANSGTDGQWVVDTVKASGVYTLSGVLVSDDLQTGRAIIQVSKEGENSIFLFPGANHRFDLGRVQSSLEDIGVSRGDYFISANETNFVFESIALAAEKFGAIVVYNPAPMPTQTTDEFVAALSHVSILVVNETELVSLCEMTLATAGQNDGSAVAVSEAIASSNYTLLADYVFSMYSTKLIVVTQGSAGVSARLAFGASAKSHVHVPISPVSADRVVDTTAAGDTFIGYFSASLAETDIGSRYLAQPAASLPTNDNFSASIVHAVEQCMKRASYASGITVTGKGAIPSIPHKSQVDQFLATNVLPPTLD